jgi:hypothetical protein
MTYALRRVVPVKEAARAANDFIAIKAEGGQ